MLVIGGVGLYALYAYNQGALGTTTTPTTTTYTDPGYVDPGVTYTDPGSSETTTGVQGLGPLATQCEDQGGVWQGDCCSCPNDPDCNNKCGKTKATKKDACEHEGGTWNAVVNCCSCPNMLCGPNKCRGPTGPAQDPSGCSNKPGDDQDCDISTSDALAGVCESEGDDNLWNISRKCCSCPNRDCQNKCPGATTPTQAPAKKKSTGGGGGGSKLPTKSPMTAKPPVRKPAPKPGPITAAKPSKVKQCAGLTGATRTACLNSYAHAYLGSAFNRRGPSYTMRDDFRHLPNVENPSPVDFLYEAERKPYYLGAYPHPDRASLIKRFQSNFSTMRFSG
jgi:hypothetical protein